MKTFPNRSLIVAVLASAFVGVSATAIAQGAAPAASVQPATPTTGAADISLRQAQRMERMEKMMAERQTRLKAELRLSPEQEVAWSAFVARPDIAPHKRQAVAREDWSKLTTPQRLDRMQALKTERHALLTQRSDAIRNLYAVLTPEQQKVFDAHGTNGMRHAGAKGEHRMSMMGMDMGWKSGMGGIGCVGPMQARP